MKNPVSVYYHTHWDREWYLPFRKFQLRLADVVDEILERLETNVLPCFTLDGQVIVLDDYLALRPENRDRLSAMIKAGRLDIGPWLVMPDEFLVSGESLVRNLVEGIRRSQAWECHQFTGYLPDTFGHSADIPTLLQQCGIDSAVVWRGVNPSGSLFLWESPAGHGVRTLHLTDGYFQIATDDWTLTTTQKAQALQRLAQKLHAAQAANMPVLMPIGGDHMAPVPAEGRQLLLDTLHDVQETTPTAYMGTVTESGALERIQGELMDNAGSFLLPGVYSARIYLKQANRRMEHLLTQRLEPLLAMTQLISSNERPRYPKHELALAWETLILNHPHDSICGCSIDAVHRENEVRFDQVAQIAESLLYRAERQLVQTLLPDTSTGWIIHTGNHPYTGVVEVIEAYADPSEAETEKPSILAQINREETILQDEYRDNAHRIPLAHLTEGRRHGWIWADNLSAFSINRLPEKTSLPTDITPVDVTERRLKNGRLAVSLMKDGTLSILDLQSGQEATNLLIFQDQPDQGDSYNSAPVPGEKPLTAALKNVRIITAGPLVGILELTHCFANGLNLTTQVKLAAGSRRLDFETVFTNTLPHHKLQVGFSAGAPIENVLAESHFSRVIRRYNPNYWLANHMPAEKNRELKTNTGPVQRFFSTNGHGWITEGLTEYEVYQETMYITLLRAFSALSATDTGVRGAQAGPPLPTPEGECLQRTMTTRYAWLPITGVENPVAHLYAEASRFYGNVWGYRPLAQASDANTAERDTTALSSNFSLITWDSPELIASACYWQPEHGLVLRLMNTGTEVVTTVIRPGFPCKAVYTTNFLGERQGLPLPVGTTVGEYSVSLANQGVQTLLFEVL